MGVIISAFPGCGKTYAFNNRQDKFRILDSDSSNFKWVKDKDGNNTKELNPEFPKNYIKHIKENIDSCDIIFVSTHKEVRDALRENNMNYTLIYPRVEDKEEYMQRYIDRGSTEDFINIMNTNFEKFINELEEEEFPKHVVLPIGSNRTLTTEILMFVLYSY